MLLQCKIKKIPGTDYEITKDIDDMYAVTGKELNLDPSSPRKKPSSKENLKTKVQVVQMPRMPHQDYIIEASVRCR